jgi:hypothetical protein
MKNSIFLLACFLFQISYAQEKLLLGKINADGNFAEGINIVNLVNEKSTISDAKGEFKILAKQDDLVVFSAMNFEYKRKLITSEDIESGNIVVEMIPKVNQIDVVVIEDYQLDAVTQGILTKPAKRYTPAERKLKTANDWNLGVGFGLTFSFDPIINAISGRTKRLKEGVATEKQEKLLKRLNDLFEPSYFTETLKIPMQKVSGFQYLAIEDEQLISAIELKNRTFTSLRLIQLSQIYKELQADEK